VEDRLPLLIQKRLNSEIQQHPPLFPWETEVEEYETTEAESGHPKLIHIPISSPEPNCDVPADKADAALLSETPRERDAARWRSLASGDTEQPRQR
jgi:hypothetical protein